MVFFGVNDHARPGVGVRCRVFFIGDNANMAGVAVAVAVVSVSLLLSLLLLLLLL